MIPPSGRQQAGGVQGTFDFQKGDTTPIGCDDDLGGGQLQRHDGLGDEDGAQGLAKRCQVGKRSFGCLAGGALCRRRGQGWGGLEQGLQAVDVFGQHGLAVEIQEALNGLLFCRRPEAVGRRQTTLVPTRVAATETQSQP
jgi:hypothetical protein